MFIDDEELRSLYEVASAEHLTAIEEGLLQLEKKPTDLSPLPMLLREAHSLKGDSRMLGVEDAEAIVHQMEEILMVIDRQELAITPLLCDVLYQGLDAVRKVAHEAITGEPTGLQLVEVIAVLQVASGKVPISTVVDKEVAAVATTVPSLIESGAEPVLNWLEDLTTFPQGFADFATIPNNEYIFSNNSALDDYWSNSPAAMLGIGNVLEQPELVAESPASPDMLFESFDVDTWAEGNTLPATESISSTELMNSSPGSAVPPILADIPIPTQPLPTVPAEPVAEVFEINTIRVATNRLERLMIQADELAVAKLRVVQHHEDLLNLYRLWEDWQRLVPIEDPRLHQFSNLLNQMRLTSGEDTARLESVANDLENGIRQIRMLPLQTVFALFPRMVRDLARQQGKEIDFAIEGGDVLADKQILEALKDPLTHILRNAIDHGIETLPERGTKKTTARLTLQGLQRGNQIEIVIRDDGRGLDLEAIRATAIRRGLYTSAELDQMNPEQIQSLIFVAGFSTRTAVTELSGRGVGMDVVRANIEKLKGSIRIESQPGEGCTFRLLLNNSLATVDALIVQVNNQPFALALDAIETMQFIDREEIFTLDGKLTVHWQDRGVSVAWLADLLELPVMSPDSTLSLRQVANKIPCVFIKIDGEYLGILVDELLEQQQIVVKALNQLLQNVRNLSGASILGNGEICMVLNPPDLFSAAGGRAVSTERSAMLTMDTIAPPHILLVEDSIPIRTQVKRILEGAGYVVTTAVDGLDGFNKLQAGEFAAVVSDVEMPNMTGLELTSRLREFPEYGNLPVILVTTLAKPEDQQRGLDAGATAYLTKGNFDQSLLINTLRSLIAS
jgi:two-component system, chemotaxis family, sensor kinase CheA